MVATKGATSAGSKLYRLLAQQQPQQLGVSEALGNACYWQLFNRNPVQTAGFSSSASCSSNTANPGDTGVRPSTNDDRVDLDRYTRADAVPEFRGPAPTEVEGQEIYQAEHGADVFTAGESGEYDPAATAQAHPATESGTVPPHQHESATTADFGGDPVREEPIDAEAFKQGHAIPNEAADSH